MSKYLIYIIVLVLNIQNLFSQNNVEKSLTYFNDIGIFEISNLSNKKFQGNTLSMTVNSPDYDSKISYGFGFNINVLKYGKWSLYQNFEYSKSIYTAEYIDLESVQFEEKLNWFKFPILIEYSVLNNSLSPILLTGISFDFLDESRGTFNDELTSTEKIYDLKNIRKEFNTSFCIGLGLKYSFGRSFLKLDMTYIKGLTDIVNSSESDNLNEIMMFTHNYYDNQYSIDTYSIKVGFNLILK